MIRKKKAKTSRPPKWKRCWRPTPVWLKPRLSAWRHRMLRGRRKSWPALSGENESFKGFEALARHCAASLADFKVPRFWQTWEEFPKNQMNRVVKAGLKKETAGAGPVYDQRRK